MPSHSLGTGVPRSVSAGIAAPTRAVDDIAEKFGRPRARSLSRHDLPLSLPPWAEDEDAEGAALPSSGPPPRLVDRRRTVSMSSVTEDYRGGSRRPSSQVLCVALIGKPGRRAYSLAVRGGGYYV